MPDLFEKENSTVPEVPMVVLVVLALFTFNLFASGICHASWHGMSDLKQFHTHGHRNADNGAPRLVACIEKRNTGGYHLHHCSIFDSCVKAPEQQVVRHQEVRPAPPGPDLSCPGSPVPVPADFHAWLVYRGPPAR